MARGILVVISSVLVVFSCFLAVSSLEESNPIKLATDRLLDLETSFVDVIGRTSRAISFARFAHRYGKRYETEAELRRRFEIYSKSLDLINSTNRKGLSYTLGVNEFADWTWEEFQSYRLGAPQNLSAATNGNHKFPNDIVPPQAKDWRDEGIIGRVKNQGSCGSCWAFSATGALEAAYHQAFGNGIYLSEQQLVDCSRPFNNFGCKGGWPSRAYDYIMYNRGLDTEKSYPYTGVDGQCNFLPQNVGVQVRKYVNIKSGDEYAMKVAVGLVRPVNVAYQVIKGFQYYKSGVYRSDDCDSSPSKVNHAVLVVGYGVEGGIPYWICKNSWGAGWGDSGYFKIQRGTNMCGIATAVTYPIVAV